MGTTLLRVIVDQALHRQAQERARLENLSLDQVIQRLLRKWVRSPMAAYETYVVRPSDTLAQIAVKFYGDAKRYSVIAEANGITDIRLLRVGQTLRIPPLSSLPPKPVPAPEDKAREKPGKLKIEFVQSPHYNQRPADTKIWAIVVHATANSSLNGVITWFQNPQSMVSAHYNIGKDGRIVQTVRDKHRAWHAGVSIWKGVPDVNDYSLGIELVNKNDGVDPYPEAQYQALVALCKKLVAEYDVKIEDIMGHKDIHQKKTDPAGFDLERLRRDVAT